MFYVTILANGVGIPSVSLSSGWHWRLLESQVFLLKGPCTDSLGGTRSGLRWRGRSLQGTRDPQGETELCAFPARAGETATIVPMLVVGSIFPVLTPSYRGWIWTCISLGSITLPILLDPWEPAPSNSGTTSVSLAAKHKMQEKATL